MSRPETLFPLFADITGLAGIGTKSAAALSGAGIETPRDLVFTLPVSGVDRSRCDTIAGLQPGQIATVAVDIGQHHPPRTRGRPYRIAVSDAQTSFQLVFFHAREDWLKKQLPTGERRVVSGKVEHFDGIAQIVHPDHILRPEDAEEIPPYEPVYPLTAGITQRTMARAAQDALSRAPDLPEWIDTGALTEHGWPRWIDAARAAHHPTRAGDLLASAPPRERLAYDEMFAHQLTLALARAASRRKPGRETTGTGKKRDLTLAKLPFKPTAAQLRADSEISGDMASPFRMNRLLQGDVGSGKTLVAFLALLNAVEAGGQGAMMAPTEILARQHFEGLRPLAEDARVVLDILTGRDRGAEREAKLEALKKGEIQILVGTHALFQRDVEFRDLRLAVIDEQHRFGVTQRMDLGTKGDRADVLVMTATPIPRSLSLAQFGHMDVSVLDEKPPGRKPISTALVSMGRMDEVVAHLRKAVGEGRQAYWVCPLVEDSEVVDLTAAEDRFKRLRAALGEGVVGLVHGQMPASEKDKAMADFEAGRTQVLVATTVIEVGVDVPNATIMVIERAESFGLAQLHQLRGRVGRGDQQSTCLLIYRSPLSEGGRRRLEILRETEDGFRIAEEDLAMRGAGDVIGTAQSGLPKFRIADLERQSGLMATAQKDARLLIEKDPDLKQTARGEAARTLLWLMEQDRAFKYISIG